LEEIMRAADISRYDHGKWERNAVLAVLVFLSLPVHLCGASLSFTGTLASPEDTFIQTINIGAAPSIIIQTWGFGGGTNAANTLIAAGGFDPFVGLFQGTGPTALFLDGTADNLSNYTSEPSACPPAGLVTIGSVAGQCGDVNLQFFGLAAGEYTLFLSDANYVPNAVYETTGFLGDGFSDLTGGVFQTCYDASDCNTDTANWAVDMSTSGGQSSTPEPASFVLTALGLVVVSRLALRRRRSE
jgi:hypothetical protein